MQLHHPQAPHRRHQRLHARAGPGHPARHLHLPRPDEQLGRIGYNFLVDKFGRTWEGRAGGITDATIGAHAFGFSTWTTGISVMGNYTTAAISDPAWDALVDVTAWKLSERGVDVNGTMTVNGAVYPALVGHRDVGVTECPGDQLYERLDELRSAVSDRQEHYDGAPDPSPEPEVSPDLSPEPEPEISPEPEPSPDLFPEPETDLAPGLLGTPPAATVGAPYEFTFTVTGDPRPTVGLSDGTLPAGLVLDESGTLSGTPQEPSTSTFTVTASNDVGPDASLEVELVAHAAQVEVPDDEAPTLVADDGDPGSAGPGGSGPGDEPGEGAAPPTGDRTPDVAPVATGDITPKGGQLAATGAVVATALGMMVLALGAGAALLRRARVVSG